MNRIRLLRGNLRPTRAPHHNRAVGVTLVELLIVMAITSIVAAIAVPRYGQAINRYHLKLAAARVDADLDLVRRQSRLTTTSLRFVVNTATNSYTIPTLSAMNQKPGDYAVDLSAEPYGAAIYSADFAGDTELVFDAYGTPDSNGIIIVNVGDQAVAVALNSATNRITVSTIQPLSGGVITLPPKAGLPPIVVE